MIIFAYTVWCCITVLDTFFYRAFYEVKRVTGLGRREAEEPGALDTRDEGVRGPVTEALGAQRRVPEFCRFVAREILAQSFGFQTS